MKMHYSSGSRHVWHDFYSFIDGIVVHFFQNFYLFNYLQLNLVGYLLVNTTALEVWQESFSKYLLSFSTSTPPPIDTQVPISLRVVHMHC